MNNPSSVVNPGTQRPTLILGSTSVYRRELLARFRLPFETRSPEVDESALPSETPEALALRLAQAKALAVAAMYEGDVVVIGSDQVADLNGLALGKPGHHAAAMAQWQAMRGQTVRFHTAVTVTRPRTGFTQTALSTVSVLCRNLSDQDIDTYLQLEQPYDCAGSAKCEGLGITLLDRIESDDPTALVGLPLILTAQLLRAAGLDVLSALNPHSHL